MIFLLCKYSSVFSDQPGLRNQGEHSIQVESNGGIPRRKLYSVPLVFREEVDRQITELLKQGIIEPSFSPYAHPIVCVKKKDGSLRLAVDYRAVNSITISQEFPMKNANELLMQVGAAKFITTFDATQGYYQIPLAMDGSREKSAFVTHSGLYQFTRMPFGLKCAAATFQRTMNKILQGCDQFSAAFIDDFSTFSGSWEEHLKHMEVVLKRIQNSGLTLKLAKCSFAQPQVKYLGHVVGG